MWYTSDEKGRKKEYKNGQVTLFIIIGSILLITAGAFIYYMNSSGKEGGKNEIEQSFQAAAGPVANYLRGCLNDIVKEAAVLTAFQGGYASLPGNSTFNHSIETAYYHYGGKSDIPSHQSVALSISGYVDGRIGSCLNASPFAAQGYTITKGSAVVKTIIGEKDIIVTVEDPALVIQPDGAREEIDGVAVRIPGSTYDAMLRTAENITLDYAAREGRLCASCILPLAAQYNLSVTVSNPEKGITIIVIDALNAAAVPPAFTFALG